MKNAQFVVCLSNNGYAASLEVGKLYRFIPDEDAEKLGGLRVIDEDGEDYFYDSAMFCPVHVPPVAAQLLIEASKQG
jgi:hypothetical protein